MSVQDKVKKIIAEKLGVDLEEVVPEASFVDDLGADSLDLVELAGFGCVAVRKFGVEKNQLNVISA